MDKQDLLKLQTCVLKVNIDCDGCKQKVKKLLQKIDGVYSINIDEEQGKVTVTGNIDPSILIKRLAKSGKQSEIYGGSQKSSNINQNNLNKLIKNIQIENENVAKHNKSPNGFQQTLQQMKGTQKDKDSQVSDRDFDDQDVDYGFGPSGMMIHVHAKKDKKGKKIEVVDMPCLVEGKVGKNSEGGKKGGSSGNRDGGEWNVGGEDKSGGRLLGFGRKAKFLFGFGKRGNKKNELDSKDGGGIGKININGAKWAGFKKLNNEFFLVFKKNISGAKKKEGKNEEVQEFKKLENLSNGSGISKQGGALKAGGSKNLGQMGQMGPMGQGNGKEGQIGPMGQLGNILTVQGGPTSAMDGGGYQATRPYSQDQRYLDMRMNQQRTNGNDMLQPMMYEPPYTAANYWLPPPMAPPVVNDHYTTFFSDENANSCSIM